MTPKLRPTRRGYAILAVGTGALVAGAVFGPRTLDAVVLPIAVALVAAVVQVWRTPEPSIERRLPPADEVGTTGVVELVLDAPDPYPATVRDRLPTGVRSETGDADGETATVDDETTTAGGREAVIEATVGGDAVAYEVTPTRRGEHELGPASVVATDVLGLVERTHEVETRDGLVAFPRVRSLSGAVRADLRAVSRSRSAAGRDEFDGLREYVRGDALRDVHWKSSAKRDDLVVREFTADADPERVTVAAGTVTDRARGDEERTENGGERTENDSEWTENDGAADAMAEAAASVCLTLVRDGAGVTMVTPSGTVEATAGRHRELLDHLAVVEGGAVPTGAADVEIVAGTDSTTVRFDGRRHDFETLVDGGDADGEWAAGSAESDGGVAGSAGGQEATSTFGDRGRADERGPREVYR